MGVCPPATHVSQPQDDHPSRLTGTIQLPPPEIDLRLNEVNVWEFTTEGRFAGKTESLVENRGIDRAEVGVESEIALVDVGQAGMFANESTFICRCDDKHL